MRSILFTVLIALTSTAIAGDGGFDLTTCTSASGRTNLTIHQDNYSDASVPAKVIFGIDGQFVTYAPKYENGMDTPVGCEDDCLAIDFFKNQVVVRNGDSLNMQVIFDGKKAVVSKGFFDPRPDYNNYQVGAIELSCKSFHQEP